MMAQHSYGCQWGHDTIDDTYTQYVVSDLSLVLSSR